jgi:CBS domain-containing protein
MMLDAHMHRIIVVDEQRSPIGIVSSTDILAAIAYAQPKRRTENRHAPSLASSCG